MPETLHIILFNPYFIMKVKSQINTLPAILCSKLFYKPRNPARGMQRMPLWAARLPSGTEALIPPAAGAVGCWRVIAESLSGLLKGGALPKVMTPSWEYPMIHQSRSTKASSRAILQSWSSSRASHKIQWDLCSNCATRHFFLKPLPHSLPYTGHSSPQSHWLQIPIAVKLSNLAYIRRWCSISLAQWALKSQES